jgi:hypothetical protein
MSPRPQGSWRSRSNPRKDKDNNDNDKDKDKDKDKDNKDNNQDTRRGHINITPPQPPLVGARVAVAVGEEEGLRRLAFACGMSACRIVR